MKVKQVKVGISGSRLSLSSISNVFLLVISNHDRCAKCFGGWHRSNAATLFTHTVILLDGRDGRATEQTSRLPQVPPLLFFLLLYSCVINVYLFVFRRAQSELAVPECNKFYQTLLSIINTPVFERTLEVDARGRKQLSFHCVSLVCSFVLSLLFFSLSPCSCAICLFSNAFCQELGKLAEIVCHQLQ